MSIYGQIHMRIREIFATDIVFIYPQFLQYYYISAQQVLYLVTDHFSQLINSAF